MRTPLNRVRHLGAAHSGTEHFWRERISGAASLVLTAVFIVVILAAVGRPYEEVVAVVGSPPIAALFVMFIAAVVIHMRLGMESIILDYVPSETQKIFWLVANTFFAVTVAAVAILAILKISFGV